MASSVNFNNADDVLAADGTNIDLPSAGHAGADMSAIVEQGVLLLAVANLAEIHLLLGDLPVADAFAVALAVLVAADVLVARLLLDEGTLSMALILKPVAIVGITGWVLQETFAVAFAEHVVAGVGGGGVRDMRAFAVEVAILEFTAIIITGERGVDGLGPREGFGRMIASGSP
ncbi:uncharacterized protein LDX57_008497 [Aspergillus melleus]|uniref:uncharacterized protein n=1 Tax=Aspergillus melleus TaxID=138277 RepID=UPI001E8DF7AF|nr:uncharacterized protein LDX57_008497 [Aspergillus melleus]KAH8430833.1 hypothetical protein LDX57_008497 [Aspergillus melleus]